MEDTKLVLDDARARQSALLQLIYFTDQQAVALLRLYVTIGLASITGAIAALSPGSPLSADVSYSLGAASAVLLLGCYFCYQATGVKTSAVSLPGRGADFWKIAVEAEYSQKEVLMQYLDELAAGQLRDKELNVRTARALRYAKLAGIASPAIGIVVFLGAVCLRHADVIGRLFSVFRP